MTERVKRRYDWLYKAFVVALLTGLTGSVLAFAPRAIDAINNRTFDTAQQKMKVLDAMEAPVLIDPAEKERIFQHISDENIHMDFDEKAAIIRMEQNITRVGQDLEEIKNLQRAMLKAQANAQ